MENYICITARFSVNKQFSSNMDIYPITAAIIFFVSTVAFIFWFIFLLKELLLRKAIYKSALKRCNEYNGTEQRETVYKANTDYNKSIFLFLINIFEWIAGMYVFVDYMYFIGISLVIHFRGADPIENQVNSNIGKYLWGTEILGSYIFSNIMFTGYNFLLLTLMSTACLCNYLTARYARKSWIKHDKIPYIITLTVVFIIITQISSLFCYLTLIVRWVHMLVLVLVLVFGMHQSRKLRMVINWTVVDLAVGQNNLKQLNKLKRMIVSFRIYITIYWIGCICLFISILGANVNLTSQIVLQNIFSPNHHHYNPCTNENNAHNDHKLKYITFIETCFSVVENIACLLGYVLVHVPYTVYGYYTMSVLIWRRVTGRSEYCTRYSVFVNGRGRARLIPK